MGRPLNHKYFGDNNITASGADLGGEGVASVAVTGSFSGKTPGTYDIPASVISAPQIAGGLKPTLTLTYLTATTASVAVVTPGAGYTGTTTISGAALQALGGAGTGTIVLTATMTSTRDNAIAVTAFIPALNAAGYVSGAGGTASTSNGDIIRQTGSRSYLVQTSEGVGKCTLVTATPAAGGQMIITASDSTGTGNYYVTKLTNRKVWLTRQSTGSGWEFATGAVVSWTLGSAVLNTSVSIGNN